MSRIHLAQEPLILHMGGTNMYHYKLFIDGANEQHSRAYVHRIAVLHLPGYRGSFVSAYTDEDQINKRDNMRVVPVDESKIEVIVCRDDKIYGDIDGRHIPKAIIGDDINAPQDTDNKRNYSYYVSIESPDNTSDHDSNKYLFEHKFSADNFFIVDITDGHDDRDEWCCISTSKIPSNTANDTNAMRNPLVNLRLSPGDKIIITVKSKYVMTTGGTMP